MKRLSLLGFFALAFTVAVSSGCSKKDPVPPSTTDQNDAGETPTDGDAGVDGGVDAGFVCKRDDDCAQFKAGLRCDYPTGACVPAKSCNTQANCDENLSGAEYCSGVGCRCVAEASVDGGTATGVCRRRLGVCDECTTDEQCGSVGLFTPVGKCAAFPGDTSGKKYCLQKKEGPLCECGFIDDGTGYCKPQNNVCSGTGCAADTDCPGGSVCNAAACLCEPRCRWDFAQGTSVPECGQGKSCWVDQANLNPTSKFYGAGRCRPACSGDTDCTDTQSNPYGGPDLVCKQEQTAAGPSLARCRAEGECMDSAECPTQPRGAAFKGYCDRASRTCETDCRLGKDPVTGLSFDDCRFGFKCVQNGSIRECVRKGCSELGGSPTACSQAGQYCCGDDKDNNGTADPCPSTGLDVDQCYTAPKPPFCKTCQSDGECWGLGLSPSGSPLPNLCVGVVNPSSGAVVGICGISTWNDPTPTEFGVPRMALGCPASYTAREQPYIVNPNFDGQNDLDYCKLNTDCGPQGLCDQDPSRPPQQNGKRPLACLCQDELNPPPGRCPSATDGGIASVCRAGTGLRSCLESVICVPPGSLVFTDAGVGACSVP